MQTGTGKRCNGQTRVPNHQVGAVPTKERASAQGPQVHLGPQQQNFAVDKPLEQLHFGFAGLPVAAGLVRQQRFGLGYPHGAPVALLVGEGTNRRQKEVFFQLQTGR